jgi:hypothetical protein
MSRLFGADRAGSRFLSLCGTTLKPANQAEKRMRPELSKCLLAALLACCLVGVTSSYAAKPQQMSTPIAPGVMVPDTVSTSIGTLKLDYGYPDDATTQTVYDNLDASRALQAYLLAIPIVNQVSMRSTLREFGPVNQTDVIWEDLVDSKTVELTANDNTIYSFIWLNTKKGPLVVEVPPMVLGLID